MEEGEKPGKKKKNSAINRQTKVMFFVVLHGTDHGTEPTRAACGSLSGLDAVYLKEYTSDEMQRRWPLRRP